MDDGTEGRFDSLEPSKEYVQRYAVAGSIGSLNSCVLSEGAIILCEQRSDGNDLENLRYLLGQHVNRNFSVIAS